MFGEISDVVAAAVIGGLFGAITTLVSLHFTAGLRKSEQKENEADAAARVGEAWALVIAPLEKRVKALEDENAGLKNRVKELEAENQRKAALIVELETELQDLRKRFGRQRKVEEQ